MICHAYILYDLNVALAIAVVGLQLNFDRRVRIVLVIGVRGS